MKKRQRSNTQTNRPSHKKSRQEAPPSFSSTFKTTFSSASPPSFTWTPQPVSRVVTSSIFLQEMMIEIREQREILKTIVVQQQELINDVKKIMTTMGLNDSKPEMMDSEYNYYA